MLMNIIVILRAVIFIVIPLLALALAFLLGWKRNIYQSGSKLAMTVLSIVISILIVKLTVPGVVAELFTSYAMTLEGDAFVYLSNSSIIGDIVLLVSGLAMPAVFLVVYMLISLVFLLLYLIPGRLLSDKAFAKRAATKETEEQALPEIEAHTEEIKAEDAEKKPCNRARWLKVATVACSLISTFLVLAYLALPISYYSNAVIAIEETVPLAEDMEFSDAVAVAQSFSNHPVNIVYKPFNGLGSGVLDSFKTSRGVQVSAVDTVCGFLRLSQSVEDITSGTLTPTACYALADQLEQNPFINGAVSNLLLDMVQSWQSGAAFMGIAPIGTGSAETDAMIYSTMTEYDDAATVLRLLGDMLSLQNVMQPDAQGREEALFQVFNSANPKSAEMLKSLLKSDTLTAILPSAEAYGTLVNSVMNGVIQIKSDDNISDTEKTQILQQEAKSLTVVMDMINQPADIQAEALIGAVLDSRVLSTALEDVTENGTVKDPCGVAEQLTPQFVESVGDILVEKGVAENTALHNAFLALLTKG